MKVDDGLYMVLLLRDIALLKTMYMLFPCSHTWCPECRRFKRLMGMCRWMGLHFHDWIDYNGVAFLIALLEWGHTFLDFLG